MKKTVIQTSKAPAPIGPYNQGILTNGMLYISGQIPLNPETNNLETESITKETVQVMENLEAILREAGMNFSNVIKCSIFISNMDNFKEINSIYGQYFEEETAPTRETVQVAGLPKGANVEISAIAVQ